MKIYIEVPDNWFDTEKLDNIGFVTRTCKEEMRKILMESISKKLLETLPIPKIVISKKELKKAVLDRIVEDKMYER